MQSSQQAVNSTGDPFSEDHVICEIGRCGTDGNAPSAHGDRVDQEHHNSEDRQAENTVRNDLVDPVGCGQAVLLCFLLYGSAADVCDIVVSFIGDDGFGIIVQLFLTVSDMLLDLFGNGAIQVQLFHHLLVTLEDLDRIPTQIFSVFDNRLDGLLDMRDRMLGAALENVRSLAHRRALCSGNDRICDSIDTVGFQCAHLENSAAELLRQLCSVNGIAVLRYNIHHVDGDDGRDAELQQLGGQIEITLDIRAVHDIQDRIGFLLHQILTGNNFLQRIR